MEFLHEFKRQVFDLDKVNFLAEENLGKLIKDSEEIYKKQMDEIATEIAENGQYKIILLAGPSSSGKTTSSNLIRDRLYKHGYNSQVVSLDDFFVNRDKTPRLKNGDYDFESIKALDLEYLNKFIDDIFEKGEADMPEFDFLTGNRKSEYKRIKVDDKTILIIEGIHALNPIAFNKHRENMYKIYICLNTNFMEEDNLVIPAQKLRLMRRLIRDYYTRGATIKRTLEMWPNVLAGEDLYIKPYKNTADYLIDSTHAYEPLLYAYALLPLLKESETCPLLDELIGMLEDCLRVNPNVIPEDSLLHEFVG
ncbi:MAG: nucleoside kinase [Clostridia bacterium]|nr:nucleoside kinase [Clostridia bacterium]